MFPIPMESGVFRLRWETTGEQWWFASPIDWASANGHYELVKHLILLDNHLLIKLTSLARIRRLEAAWDDGFECGFDHNNVSRCRSLVAERLMRECDRDRGYNSLIRAGYGGWLLYAAASAGDTGFVKELLGRDRLLVFGGGEYGVTDILYAAARSKDCGNFRLLFDSAVSAKGKKQGEVSPVFQREMMNRAVHTAARGGCWEILMEILASDDSSDLLDYRDAQGATVLHTAAAAGRFQVVKNLISSFKLINCVDNQGNTALNTAAFHGQLSILELLVSVSSPSSATNNNGDTFLHMAISGFRAQTFRFMHRQMDFMKRLVSGTVFGVKDIINVQNKDGRTPLHCAILENIQTQLVELILSVPYVDLNACDSDGNTALDLLNQQPSSPSSRILITKIAAAGGVSGEEPRNDPVRIRNGAIGSVPGTSFGVPDAEMLFHSGLEEDIPSTCEFSSTEYCLSDDLEADNTKTEILKYSSKFRDIGRKIIRTLTHSRRRSSLHYTPVPLRQQFSRSKRALSLHDNSSLNTCTMNRHFRRPSSCSESSWSSLVPIHEEGDAQNCDKDVVSYKQSKFSTNFEKLKVRHASFNQRLMMNAHLCFGARGLGAENSNSPKGQLQVQDHHFVAVK